MDDKIQFNIEDIINKFESINSAETETRKIEIGFLAHELIGAHMPIIGYIFLLEDTMLTASQKAYLDHIREISRNITDNIAQMAEGCIEKYDATSRMDLRNKSEAAYRGILELAIAAQVKDLITSTSLITPKQEEYLDTIDIGIDNTIYLNNLHFSKEFDSKEYQLDKDLKRYARQHLQETMMTAAISDPDMHCIITGFDYLKNAILPIIKNVNDHAYSPENPYSTIAENDRQKRITIWSEDNKEGRYLTISIKDNGFGIHPDVKDIMFAQGASCRAEKTGHGIGLWCVKDKIERNGGRIWFDTVPGQGTTFNFTIPYDRIDNERYFQDINKGSGHKP